MYLVYTEGLLVYTKFKFEELCDICYIKPPLAQVKRLLAEKIFLRFLKLYMGNKILLLLFFNYQ